MRETISVVIPAYNRAEWLPSAVHSVLEQTLPPTEVVIVDDGSTDDTPGLCRSFPEPVRYIRKENAGAAAARNRGIREATGDWVAFQDSDDLWEPDKLEIQAAALGEWPEAGWCTTGFSVIDMDGNMVDEGPAFERSFPVFDEEGVSADAFFRRYFEEGSVRAAQESHTLYFGDAFTPLFLGNFVFPQGTVVRRDVLEEVGGFDPEYRFAEDTNLFHRLAAEAPLLLIMTPLFRYRVGEYESIIDPSNTVALIEYTLRSIDENLSRAADSGDVPQGTRDHHRRGRARLLVRLGYTHLTNYESAAARRAFRQVWRAGARSIRVAALFLASFLPGPMLRLAHRAKRMLMGGRQAA